MTWKPMSEAPKDRRILAYGAGYDNSLRLELSWMGIVHWSKPTHRDGGKAYWYGSPFQIDMTHWMEAPAPPEE